MKSLIVFILCLASTAFAQTPPTTPQTTTIAYTQGFGSSIVGRSSRVGWVTSYVDATPAGFTFTCNGTSHICTATANTMVLGLVGQASTTSALPSGLSTSTNYYAIPIDANTFYLASSLANAKTGTFIAISSAGTGVQTFTATSISITSIALQESMDGTHFLTVPIQATGDVTKTQSSPAVATYYMLEDTNLNANFAQLLYTIAAGQITVTQIPKVPFGVGGGSGR